VRGKLTTKFGSTKMAKPRAKASNASMFAHVSAPRQKALQTRVYTKSTAKEDPTKFADFGFGDTGLTGES
jgi:hypothetical protein